MPDPAAVAQHYDHRSLLGAIEEGVRQLGKSPETVGVEDLGPVDEFHIGGRPATRAFLDQLDIATDHRVLDVGCGLGGAGRFAAQQYGCRVTGIDLTEAYVVTGRALCAWVGLGDRITLDQGDATRLPYPDGTFDRAYLLHVAMNIADKTALMTELYRVLRPGGRLGVYDVMRVGPGALRFPVPWATVPEESDVATPQVYRAAMEAAGFTILAERNRSALAAEFFAALAARGDRPPPLGLHILMGPTAPVKVQNMIRSVSEGIVAPVELMAERPV